MPAAMKIASASQRSHAALQAVCQYMQATTSGTAAIRHRSGHSAARADRRGRETRRGVIGCGFKPHAAGPQPLNPRDAESCNVSQRIVR